MELDSIESADEYYRKNAYRIYPEPGYMPYGYVKCSSNMEWYEARLNVIPVEDTYVIKLTGAPEDYEGDSLLGAWDIQDKVSFEAELKDYIVQLDIPVDVPIVYKKDDSLL